MRLELGLQQDLHVRDERLTARADACRLLYVSDIHLRHGRSEALRRRVIDAVLRSRPDAVLLGGDLVDGDSELRALRHLVAKLREIAPVFATTRP